MKRYILGYYCQDERDLQTINKDSNRDILNALLEAYPSGLTAHDISDKTSMPIKTVYSQLTDLLRQNFIKDVQEPTPRGRPSLKAVQGSASQRARNMVVIENASSIFEREKTTLPPGHVLFSNDFISHGIK